MEDLLSQIIKEATTPKLNNLKNASQNALGMEKLPRFFSCSIYFTRKFAPFPLRYFYLFMSFMQISQFNDLFTLFFGTDKLHRQHGTHRDTSYELRSVCFTAIQMAFETKRQKFISLALNGMHVSYKKKIN